ncbi:MAG TPA: hypothetical protein VM187_16455, partial [Niastella sp.]|nr:hypothetical protein [Niastella sp.]
SYKWEKVSGPNGGEITRNENAITMAISLEKGTYTFRLTVKDNDGATDVDDIKVTVNAEPNILPVANAGNDKTITLPLNKVTLIGEGSDEDGAVDSYLWTKISGPSGSVIESKTMPQTSISALLEGTYVFRLSVTDNDGGIAADDVKVVVNAEKPILVKAGADTLLFKNQTRPDSAVLNGLASVGGSQYTWTKISGPGSTSILEPNSVSTYAVGLEEGTHVFKLTIDGKASDLVQVVVRDWQKKNVNPCRVGGGKSFVVPESSPGQYNRLYMNRDNVVGERIMGGDTLYFKGGTKTAFEIGDFGGGEGCPVYIMPKDEALVITDGYFRIAVKDSNVVQHAVLDGTVLRSKGIPYGFFIDNRNTPDAENNYSGLVANWVSDFTVKGYRSIKTGIMQIKIDAKEAPYGRYDKFIQKRIKIQDNFINGSSAEGMYIGHTASSGGQLNNSYGPPPRMDSVEISNNIIMNCGWDGIQLANARTTAIIRHNFIYKTGLQNQPSQRAGILMGANTTGIIDSNIVINSKGNGIQVFGYGAVKVHHNIVDSIFGGTGDQDGIYQSHLSVMPETFNIPLSVNNFDNLISRVERKHIKVANNSGTMIAGHTYYNTFIDPISEFANDLINANAGDALDHNRVVASFPFHVNEVTTKKGIPFISMTQAEDTETFTSVKEVVDWLFSRLNGITESNTAPVANAGTDLQITLPVDSVLLKGSGADLDGTIESYQWKKIAGPENVIVKSASEATTKISALTEGIYSFELAVTDNGKAVGKDTVSIIVHAAIAPAVNQVPVVFAGTNERIKLPKNEVALTGTAVDEDGQVVEIAWTKVSGPQAYTITDSTRLETTVAGLEEGTYLFELRATDNKMATVRDTMKITVVAAAIVTPPNAVPTALAGIDQVIQLPIAVTELKGSGKDSDGTIESYHWEKLSGPVKAVIFSANKATTSIIGLVKGFYQFELTVTDNMGATKTDTVQVTVLAAVNKAPKANAGADQTIQLPVNAVILNGAGSDEDGSVESYQWSQLAGATLADISGTTTDQAQLKNLSQGTYQFELKVKDNNDASALDTVLVTVQAAVVVPNKAPVANAGSDVTVQLPQNTAILSGSGLDEDGTIASYQWRQLSGPTQAAVATANAPQTSVNNLQQGVYQFEISVTDNKGATTTDAVLVTVNAAPPVAPNKAPTVSVPAVITLTLPANKTTVTATATDSDGSIASYQWTKISGSAQYTIAATQAAQTEISDLAKGMYVFEVKATDNKGATGSDTIRILVQTATTRP